MLIYENSSTHPLWIEKIKPDGIVVGASFYRFPLRMDKDKIHPLNVSWDDIDLSVFQAALNACPEIVVVGSAKERKTLPDEIVSAFLSSHIGLEIMPTASACKVANLLREDERDVWLWLW